MHKKGIFPVPQYPIRSVNYIVTLFFTAIVLSLSFLEEKRRREMGGISDLSQTNYAWSWELVFCMESVMVCVCEVLYFWCKLVWGKVWEGIKSKVRKMEGGEGRERLNDSLKTGYFSSCLERTLLFPILSSTHCYWF